MTQEEKARAYDEAISIAKKELNACGSQNCDVARQIFRLFPELKESEDEKVRKELISFVRGMLACHDKPNAERDEKYESWIAWLEKQDEQKETLCDKCRREQPSHSCQDITELGRCALEHQSKQKPTDKIEPKFKKE